MKAKIKNPVFFIFSDDIDWCRQNLKGLERIVFVEGNVHKASFAAGIAYNKFVNSDFADTAYFEPDYGKDFVPGKPTIKGLK